MKINKIDLLRSISALLLCAGVASCSQDDLGTDRGEPLPPGKYPLMLTATVDGMTTRTAGKDFWITGDTIGVRKKDDTGLYELNANGTVKRLVKQINWNNTDESDVKAWFPHDMRTDVAIADQTGGFADIDYLSAIAKDQTFAKPVLLSFKHQMAKVSCVLVRDPEGSINDEEWASVSLAIAGFTKASFSEGTLTGKDHDWITPCYDPELKAYAPGQEGYETLVVPQDMTDRDFIRIKIEVKVGENPTPVDKTFCYRPVGNLEEGTHYFYKIIVKKTGLVVEPITATWDDRGQPTPHPADDAVFKVYLNNDRPENLEFDGTFVKKDGTDFNGTFVGNDDNFFQKDGNKSYIEVKGNSFTISYLKTDPDADITCSLYKDKEKTVKDKVIDEKPVTTAEGDKYTWRVELRSEVVTLTCTLTLSNLEVGDFYYSDGTTSNEYDNSKECIGIVFKVGAGGDDDPGDYSNIKDENGDPVITGIRGYVVALKDAKGPTAWCPSSPINYTTNELGLPRTGATPAKTAYNGYTSYRTATNDAMYKEAPDQYYALYSVANYNTSCAAPMRSSKWYLPAAGQLADIYTALTTINNKLDQTKDNKKIRDYIGYKDFYVGRYWSITVNNKNAYYVDFSATKLTVSSTTKNYTPPYVRAVLTF